MWYIVSNHGWSRYETLHSTVGQLTEILVVMNYLSRIWLAAEFGWFNICTCITFYQTRKLFYSTFIPYLDSKQKTLFYIKMFIFVYYQPVENLSNVMLL